MAKLSRRERWAKKTGRSKYEYRKSAEGRAVTKIEDYYDEIRDQIGDKADIDIDRLKEDFERVLERAGVQKTRAIEDYVKNLKYLTENKATENENLNYYVKTEGQRTQEDLDTNLEKEAFRYELEQDRMDMSMASKNLAFGSLGKGGVRGEQDAILGKKSKMNVDDIETAAGRSFEDIKRLEFVKNRQIEQTFERGADALSSSKKRTLEDLDFSIADAKTGKKRGIQDVKRNEDLDLWNTEHSEDSDIFGVESSFDVQRQNERHNQEMWNILGR